MAARSSGAKTALRRIVAGGEALVPLAFVTVVVLMIVPIPTPLLDLLLALNISLSLIVLLLAMYTLKPLEFSSFPALLLVLTLFRLGLNVASTRLILGRGAEGPAAAGHVIEAFGHFVVGGNYAVGIVIFLILVLINFVVITKGSGRIAEVAARFTLDAMPGKQLAVDAELNSGMLTEQQARERRRSVEAEADFYGAMDGASKFVRGDAIAGLMIAGINIVGGLFIGVIQSGLPILDAAAIYTTLTVGDGLVSQVPALLISTASGIIVTRAASGTDLGSEVTSQLLFNPKVLTTVAVILGGFAVMPGLPFLPFIVLAGSIGGLARIAREGADPAADETVATAEKRPDKDRPEMAAGAAPAPLDLLELEVGYELVPLVDGANGGELIERIRSLRSQLAQELGVPIPPIHIRDNLQLRPGEYAVLLKGAEIARYELRTGYQLAIGAGGVDPSLGGVPTREPAFNLEALWVPLADRERAQLGGYTVVDLATVVVTHLTELIRRHAPELLGRQEVQGLLDTLARTHPKVVEELVPVHLSLGGVQKVLQGLLREGVSVRDTLTVIETLADHAPTLKDSTLLTEQVRQALSRTIVRRLLSDQTLAVITLSPALERRLLDSLQRSDEGAFLAVDPGTAQELITRLARACEDFSAHDRNPALLCSTSLRPHLRRLVERFVPSLAVLSPGEIPAQIRVQSRGVIDLGEDGGHAASGGTGAFFEAVSPAAGGVG
jgi:flagellar biosynthesis protein FlhA